MINKINILINYKFDIFIEYFTNKLNDDGDYYNFLLNSIGNPFLKGQSIANIFKKILAKRSNTVPTIDTTHLTASSNTHVMYKSHSFHIQEKPWNQNRLPLH